MTAQSQQLSDTQKLLSIGEKRERNFRPTWMGIPAFMSPKTAKHVRRLREFLGSTIISLSIIDTLFHFSLDIGELFMLERSGA